MSEDPEERFLLANLAAETVVGLRTVDTSKVDGSSSRSAVQLDLREFVPRRGPVPFQQQHNHFPQHPGQFAAPPGVHHEPRMMQQAPPPPQPGPVVTSPEVLDRLFKLEQLVGSQNLFLEKITNSLDKILLSGAKSIKITIDKNENRHSKQRRISEQVPCPVEQDQ